MEREEIINNIKKYLIEKYGEVKPEWILMINLLSDNLYYYELCSKSIAENGVFNITTGKKNPLLATLKDLQATIIKQVQHLGISPYAESKIKQISEDDTEDYINTLIN